MHEMLHWYFNKYVLGGIEGQNLCDPCYAVLPFSVYNYDPLSTVTSNGVYSLYAKSCTLYHTLQTAVTVEIT